MKQKPSAKIREVTINRIPPVAKVRHSPELIVDGEKGDVKSIEHQPPTMFRILRFAASDTKKGTGTEILGLFVDGENQLATSALGPIPTAYFMADIDLCATRVCRADQKIVVKVRFLETCRFACCLFVCLAPAWRMKNERQYFKPRSGVAYQETHVVSFDYCSR